MCDEDYELIEHPRLELHFHVATKFVEVPTHKLNVCEFLAEDYDDKNDMQMMIILCWNTSQFDLFQFGSIMGLVVVGPIVGGFRGRSLAAAGENLARCVTITDHST